MSAVARVQIHSQDFPYSTISVWSEFSGMDALLQKLMKSPYDISTHARGRSTASQPLSVPQFWTWLFARGVARQPFSLTCALIIFGLNHIIVNRHENFLLLMSFLHIAYVCEIASEILFPLHLAYGCPLFIIHASIISCTAAWWKLRPHLHPACCDIIATLPWHRLFALHYPHRIVIHQHAWMVKLPTGMGSTW